MKPLSDDEFTAFIGIDWADTKHDICLQAAHSERHEFSRIEHKVDAIDQWAMLMRQRFGGPIAVALELSKGPLVYALQKYDFFVLFPINPSTLAKYREAFKPSRAKDDPTDAEHALDLLVHHRDRLTALKPQSAPMRTLLHLVEQRRRLVGDKTRFTNRLGYALKQYFPQALDWFEHIDTIVFCDFLARWPTLIQIKRARATSVKAFFWSHNVRFVDVIEERIRAIKVATPLTHDVAVITAYRLQALVLVDQLRATLQAIERFDAQIAEVAPTLPDYALFKALPGAGVQLTPRLLVAFGEQRERFAGAADLQKYSGVAPVTERSGNKCWIHWRWQCPTFLRQTFVEWAAQTIPRSYWAGAFYRQQRDKGSSHQAALRALAFKWLRILYRCWQTRTPYDESASRMETDDGRQHRPRAHRRFRAVLERQACAGRLSGSRSRCGGRSGSPPPGARPVVRHTVLHYRDTTEGPDADGPAGVGFRRLRRTAVLDPNRKLTRRVRPDTAVVRA